jgi:hypothetical protein
MRAIWIAFETLDRATFVTLDKVDKWLGRETFRERTEKAVSHVRPAQKAITFEK